MSSESESSLKLYLRDITKTSLLTREEEIRLGEKIQNGTPEEKTKARDSMIQANLRLVVKIAQDYAKYGMPVMDLISEGNIGLMKAAIRFDPENGAKFSTYAAWWIKQSIKRALANQSKTVRLPVHMVDKVAKMRRIIAQLTEEIGRDPTNEEISGETGLPERKVGMIRSASQRPTSLDAPVHTGESMTHGDAISDEKAIDPYENTSERDMQEKTLGFLDVLNKREREVIEKRFGLNGSKKEHTLEQIGAEFGVTRERIRQIETLAIDKMRKALQKKEKPNGDSDQKAPSKQVADIIRILSSHATRREVLSILGNSQTPFDEREKRLRNIFVEGTTSWYMLGVCAIRELRKGQEGKARRKITYADVETFLRANVFAEKNLEK